MAVFLLGTCALLNLYSTQPILKEVGAWAAVSDSTAAWTVSIGTLGVAFMAPIAGAISDRIGRKQVMLRAIVVLAIGAALCLVAPNFTTLLLLRFVQGLAVPFIFAVAVAYVADEFPAHWAVLLNSVYMAGMAFGGLTGRLTAGVAVDITDNWRLAFLPLTILPIVALFVINRYLPSERHFTPSVGLRASVHGLGLHLRDWRITLTCVVGGGLLFQQVTSFTFGSLHLLDEPFNLSALQVSFVFVVMIFPTVITPFVGRIIRSYGVWLTYMGAMVVSATGMLVMLLPHASAVIAGLALSCVAVVAGQSCATRFVASYATSYRSSAVGLYLAAFYLGGTLAVPVPAPVDARYGWAGVIMVILLVIEIGVVAATIAWRVEPKKRLT